MTRDDYTWRRKLYTRTLLCIITRGRWAITFVEYEDTLPMLQLKLEINGWAEHKGEIFVAQAKVMRMREAMHEREYLETCVMQKLIDEIIKSEGGA